MSRGKNLQEMEVGTVQSKTAVNSGAKGGDAMQGIPTSAVPGQAIEDLGGPTPENYRADDDSAKLREPRLSHVSNVVNAKAGKADPMQSVGKEASYEETEAPEEETITEEEIVDETPEYNIEEDMTALFSGEELSEEFQEKAKTIFEAAISAKVAEIATQMEAKNEERIVEEIETVKSALVERVDAYLEYVADEWLQENEIAVEHGLKSEMTESFLSGMKELFEAHYVSIPEDKYDVLENMVNKLDDMESRLNEQIERNIQLNQRLSESVSDGILYDVSRGLAETQKSKLAGLAESVEFVSEEDYREKLEALRESYFPRNPVTPEREDEEMLGTESEVVSESMSAYLRAVTKFSK